VVEGCRFVYFNSCNLALKTLNVVAEPGGGGYDGGGGGGGGAAAAAVAAAHAAGGGGGGGLAGAAGGGVVASGALGGSGGGLASVSVSSARRGDYFVFVVVRGGDPDAAHTVPGGDPDAARISILSPGERLELARRALAPHRAPRAAGSQPTRRGKDLVS